MNNGYNTYRTVNVDTAGQGKLILIAYDVAIKHCKLALPLFGNHSSIEDRTKHLFKAQDAITELMSALRMDVGEIPRNLYRLYDYMLRSLVESNVKDSAPKTQEIISYLESLRSAWVEAIESIKRENGASKQQEAVGAGMSQTGFAISG